MYSTFLTVALFFGFAIHAVFADFAVSTPEILACKGKEIKVTWEPANPPYNLLIVPADDPCGDALVDAGDFQKTYATFKVDQLKPGQKVQVSIEDADGEEGWSGVTTVKECPASSTSVQSGTDSVAATTLIVTPTYGAGSDPAPTPSVDPVGAANAANNPFSNAASVPRHISVPAVALSAIAGAVALLL